MKRGHLPVAHALFAILLGVVPAAAQGTLFFEDFEDATVGYTTSLADDLANIATGDYFGRIAADTAPPPASLELGNLQGTGFYGVQDTTDTPSDTNSVELFISSLDITNLENLTFSFFVAEDDSSDGEEDWDSTSSLLVEYQIDGGGFNDLFAIEAEPISGGFFNARPLVDTDFDGVGDGAEITSDFTQFTVPIAGVGSLLDLRIRINALNSADEDIAIDNLLITAGLPGDFNSDSAVNGADFATFRDTFGAVGAGLAADGDGSGAVDAGDFGLFVDNFSAPTTPAVAAVTAIPEPAGALLILAGMALMLRRRVTVAR